jgi:hypothetical protein
VRPRPDLGALENSWLLTKGCKFDNINITGRPSNLLQATHYAIFRRIRIVVNIAYYLRHVRPSVCPHVSARLPLDEFPLNLILRTFIKICRGIGQKYRAPYPNT